MSKEFVAEVYAALQKHQLSTEERCAAMAAIFIVSCQKANVSPREYLEDAITGERLFRATRWWPRKLIWFAILCGTVWLLTRAAHRLFVWWLG